MFKHQSFHRKQVYFFKAENLKWFQKKFDNFEETERKSGEEESFEREC